MVVVIAPPIPRDNNGFTVELHGSKSNDAVVVGETLTALNGLFRAVCEEITGDPDAVRLVVTGFGFRCDSCGRRVKRLPKTWTKRGADDLCPACQGTVVDK